MYEVGQIEDGIVHRLKSQLSYLKTCDSLNELLLDSIEDITIRFPAAYVIYEGGEYSYEMSAVQDREMIFSVIVMARSLRSEAATRHGKSGEKGAYEMLEDVRAALTNHACGLAIDPLLPTDEDPIEGTDKMAAYGIRFKTRCRFTL